MQTLEYRRETKTGKLVCFTYSECDKQLVAAHTWQLDSDGYVYCEIWRHNRRKKFKFHRMVMMFPLENVDHHDGDVSNNTRPNLRLANKMQNGYNAKLSKANTSGVKGVTYYKRQDTWQAEIAYEGKKKYLGRFKNKQDAIDARKKAEELYHGEFRREYLATV